MAEIRRAGPDDWQQLRAVRLQALEADPSAFGSTLDRELAFAEDEWRGRTRSATNLLAVEAGSDRVIGIGTVRQLDDGRTGELNAMWVDPQARADGVGGQLLAALLDQARAAGCQQAQLRVTTGNDAAIKLYERAGFVATGRTEPLPSDPQLTIVEYVLALG
ncbi:MAG: GNAT family N-acetyltransferase [Jatrophihabitantaceae bacterium]